MKREEFNQLIGLLRIYPDCVSKETYYTWFDSLKRYEFSDVHEAVKRYIQESSFTPRPADIISRLPKGTNAQKFVRKYELMPDGKEVRVIACKQCNDLGLVMYCDAEGRTVGHPCTCAAAHDKYSWGWLSREEQEQWVNKNGSHGSVVGEVWA